MPKLGMIINVCRFPSLIELSVAYVNVLGIGLLFEKCQFSFIQYGHILDNYIYYNTLNIIL